MSNYDETTAALVRGTLEVERALRSLQDAQAAVRGIPGIYGHAQITRVDTILAEAKDHLIHIQGVVRVETTGTGLFG